jgi:hypothetical protein
MRDHEQCALPAAQVFFEPRDGFQVEMVRRLVQQQEIARLDECRGKGQTLPLSA